MSKTLVISLLISSSLSGAFHSAMAGTSRTIERVGKTVDNLRGQQKKLRDEMSKLPEAFSGTITPVLDGLIARSARLGRQIDLLAGKQKRLQELSSRSVQLREERRELRSRLGEAVAGAVAVGAPAFQSVRVAASFEDQVKDVAITGNLSRSEEGKLGKALRANALRVNQTQAELASGVSILVANGMTPEDAKRYSGLLGKTATATRGQMEELAQFMFSLNTSFKIEGESAMNEALDAAAHAGKQGQFELKHMARYFPELGASMASFGATGLTAVKELTMAMQVARKYSGTNEEAARNAANWFSHMSAKATTKGFHDVGIDYQGEVMRRMREQNISALQASLQVTDAYIDKVAGGKTVTVKEGRKTKQVSFRDALEKAKKSGNEAEVQALVSRFGLSNVFQDMQTVNFYLAMRQGKEMFKKGMASFQAPDAKGVIDRDFEKRMEASSEQFKKFRIQGVELGIAVGNALLPALTGILTVVTPIVGFVGSLANRFPRLTGALVGIATGLLLGKVAFLAAAYGGKVFLSMLVGQQTAATLLSTKLLFLQNTLGGGLIGAMKNATLAARGFMVANAALLGPLAAVLAAVLAVGAALYQLWKHWDTLKQPGLLKDLKGFVGSGFGLITDPEKEEQKGYAAWQKKVEQIRARRPAIPVNKLAVPAAAGNTIQTTYAPQITVPGATAKDKDDFARMLREHSGEIERINQRAMTQQQRRAF